MTIKLTTHYAKNVVSLVSDENLQHQFRQGSCKVQRTV